MAKTSAQTIQDAESSDIEQDLEDTAPLPTLQTWQGIIAGAANDRAFEDQVTKKDFERLLELAESIDKNLQMIVDTVAAPKPESPRGRKKTTATRKRTAKKGVTKQRTNS